MQKGPGRGKTLHPNPFQTSCSPGLTATILLWPHQAVVNTATPLRRDSWAWQIPMVTRQFGEVYHLLYQDLSFMQHYILRPFWRCVLLQDTSIIFIRDRNSRGQEVSAYIDYAHRLKTDEFEIYFNGKKKLFPRRTDLSFYNWDRNVSTSNASPNYQVIAENACGLLFKNKCDRKIVNVDPKAYPGDSTTRTPIETDLYLQVVIYDHILRRKT
ncbi:cilia- and flagella-associated protein 299 isoform X3 [Chrysemys picta bellii]|uniref:Cilia- and flagella-associated protein 299 n=1 Tax=Chrysemys picta bellii TaxID=8478 RepID=A0A8C3FKJ6_CHRPI|nr:cilia- and flagella-associated protein 299 isoform X2 [Chrysemys picta bellii]